MLNHEHLVAKAIMIVSCLEGLHSKETRKMPGIDVTWLLPLFKSTPEKKMFLDSFSEVAQIISQDPAIGVSYVTDLFFLNDMSKTKKISNSIYSRIKKDKTENFVIYSDLFTLGVSALLVERKISTDPETAEPISVLIPTLTSKKNPSLAINWKTGIETILEFLVDEILKRKFNDPIHQTNFVREKIEDEIREKKSFIRQKFHVKFVNEHIPNASINTVIGIGSEKDCPEYFASWTKEAVFSTRSLRIDSQRRYEIDSPLRNNEIDVYRYSKDADLVSVKNFFGMGDGNSYSKLRLGDFADIFLGIPATSTNILKVANLSNVIHYELRFDDDEKTVGYENLLGSYKLYIAHGDILISAYYKRSEVETQHAMAIVNIGRRDLCSPLAELTQRDLLARPANANIIVIRPRTGVRPWILFLMVKRILQRKASLRLSKTTQMRVLTHDLESSQLPANPMDVKCENSERRLQDLNKIQKLLFDLESEDKKILQKFGKS